MGQLKSVYLLLIMLFSLGIFFFVVYYDKTPNYDVYYVDKFPKSETIDLYVLNEKKDINKVKVNIKDKNDYKEVFSYYNEKMNSIDAKYYSPLVFYTKPLSIDKNNDSLYISFASLPIEVDNNLLLECLSKTYKELGFKEIIIKSGKSEFKINF